MTLIMQNSQHSIFPFQRKGIDFLKNKNRCGLYDTQGMGKSMQAILACKELGLRNILVVCPAYLRTQWIKEFTKWGSLVTPIVVSYNYIQLEKNAAFLSSKKWDCVIADECQALGNWTAKQTRNFALKVINQADRVWLLSGTPAVRSAANWHPLLSIIEPGKWGKFGDFCKRFCYEKTVYVKTKYRGVNKVKEIKSWVGFRQEELLNKAVKEISLRRTREETDHEFPRKFYSNLYITVDSGLLSERLGLDEDVILKCILTGNPIPEHINRVRRSLGMSKVLSCCEHVLNMNEPVIIFAWHREVVNELVRALSDNNVNVASILGQDNQSSRIHAVDRFEKGELKVLVISIAAGGTGLNIPSAKNVIFLEEPWSAAMKEQAEDRAVRITSNSEHVNIISMLASGTIDEYVHRVLEEKKKGMDSIFERCDKSVTH